MDSLTAMDDETLALILKIQIEDSSELFRLSEGKGKEQEGVLSDSQLALKLFKEDLEDNAVILGDRKISKRHCSCMPD